MQSNNMRIFIRVIGKTDPIQQKINFDTEISMESHSRKRDLLSFSN